MVEFIEGVSALLIFYAIAIVASLVLIVQFALALLGFDDIGAGELDGGDGMGFLSIRSLVGFFGGFGWTGVIMIESDQSLTAATLAGIGVGLVLMLSIAYIMKLIYSMAESGTIDLGNAVGQVGTVYVTVPGGQSGTGQVRLVIQGRLMMAPAMTRAPEHLRAEQKIRVTRLVDSRTLLVEPLGDSQGD